MLAPLTQGVDAQDHAISAAEARVGELQAKKAAVTRRQAELDAIRELRAKHAK